jgi:predicted ATP-grasp superfamily ATP-dependent carboligase
MGESAPRRTVFLHEYVTGGGLAGAVWPPSWKAEGNAMRQALAADLASVPGVEVVMTLDHRLPGEPGPWRIVRVGPAAEEVLFRRLAAEADGTIVVAPESNGILAARARLVERVGGRLLGSSPSAIELTGDKAQFAEHLRRQGLSAPETWVIAPNLGLPANFPYPAVLKPIDGAGTLATYLIPGPGACPSPLRSFPRVLLQRFCPGWPLSASFLVRAEGRAWLLGLGRQRVKVRNNGQFVYCGGTVPAAEVGAEAGEPVWQALRSVPGLRGWVGIDFIRDPETGQDTVLEINPRLTTSYIGLRRLVPPGALARAWLAALDGPEAEAEASAGLADRIRASGSVTFQDGRILDPASP